MSTRLRLGLFSLVVVALLAFAPGAFASTVTKSGADVTFTAAPNVSNIESFSDPDADTLVINTNDPAPSDPATGYVTPDGACTDTDGGNPADGLAYNITCTGTTNGTITDNAGDLNDYADAAPNNFGSGELNAGHRLVYNGGPGDDRAYGGTGADVLNGGDGRDDLRGAQGNDVINGEAGDDTQLVGGPGDDQISGGDGNDNRIYGGPGTDTLNGDAGDDSFEEDAVYCCPTPDNGNDVISGGPGYDSLEYYASGSSNDFAQFSLDDQANDGYTDLSGCCDPTDPSNNFRSDIESVYFDSGDAPITATGSSAGNTIILDDNGADTVNPGAGSDAVFTGGGTDSITADDGEADFIDCGPGEDSAVVDQFDQTRYCENVTVNQKASPFDVPEDAAPSVSWVAPTGGSIPASGTTFQVNASDDKGIQRVVFSVGLREVCTDTTAPYTCAYKPQGSDVGKNKVLIATAYDTAGQAAFAAVAVTIPRLTPTSVTARTTPSVDRKGPWKFTTSGKVNRPVGVTAADGCKGTVSVQIRAGKKTISNRRVGVQSDCTYRSSVTFAIKSRLRPGKLQVLVRFLGNEVIGPRSAKRGSVRVLAG